MLVFSGPAWLPQLTLSQAWASSACLFAKHSLSALFWDSKHFWVCSCGAWTWRFLFRRGFGSSNLQQVRQKNRCCCCYSDNCCFWNLGSFFRLGFKRRFIQFLGMSSGFPWNFDDNQRLGTCYRLEGA